MTHKLVHLTWAIGKDGKCVVKVLPVEYIDTGLDFLILPTYSGEPHAEKLT